MKKYNKDLCVLGLLLLLGVGNSVYSYEDITVNDAVPAAETQEKIKANKDTLSKAQSAIDSKDFASAINYLNGYINSKSDKYEAYKLRGDAYYALRRYDLAQKDYQTAVDIKSSEDKLATNTKYVSAILLGADKNEQLQNTELGNLYAALMYAQKALNNPSYTLSYDNAVKYNSHIYLPVQNKADINKINCPQKYAKQLNPSGVDATIASAIGDIEKGDFHSSVFKIQNVINEYPNYFMGYYLMGVALVGLEKDDDAIKSFEKAVSLNPYDFESYASLGQIYYDKAETNFSEADSQKSIGYFSKAIEYHRNCPTYYFYLGLNNLNSGNFTAAIKNFDRALRINENDYNSLYYKAIAQYINGDYNSVVSDTSKLLYKHVSNSNSVLYLRALAFNKLGQKDRALADLGTIEGNIGDVFNTDIKTVTKKDKTLINYVNYLRSKIDNGQNALAKTDNGFSNPIIKKLASVENSLKPYENIIGSKNITDEDYKKLENLYTVSLPKLLETGLVVNYDDIDTQYDFIRTTFSDIGVSFEPKANDSYTLTTIKDYYKKYAPKMQPQDNFVSGYTGMELIPIQGVSAFGDVRNVPTDKMLQAGESSLAQMLASNVLIQVSEERARNQNLANAQAVSNQNIPEKTPAKQEFKPETPQGEKANPAPIVSSDEAYVPSDKQLINEKNMQKVKDIIAEEKQADDNKDSMVFSAKEIKQTQEFKIYNEPVKPKTEPAITPAKQEVTETGNVKISAKEIKQTPDVTVKHVLVEPEVPLVLRDKAPEMRNNTEKVQEIKTETVKTVDNSVKEVKNIPQKAEQKAEVVAQTVKPAKEQPAPSDKSPYSSSVYKGLSSAAINYDLGDSKDIVELDLPSSVPNTDAGGVFSSDRLGFGVGSKPVSSVFDSSLKTSKKKAGKVASNVKETVESVPQELEETSSETVQDIDNKMEETVSDVQEIAQETQTTAKKIVSAPVSDVIVPKLDENTPTMKSSEQETLINAEEVIPQEATKIAKEEKSESLLNEYERLLKEQAKNEKLQKQEEIRIAKERVKAQKLKEKEEQERIKAEKAVQKALEQERIKEARLAVKEEMDKLKADEKAQIAEEKARLKEEKLAQKQAEKAREIEIKAQKALEKEKLKEQQLVQKQEAKALKEDVKEAVNQTKVKKENVLTKLKDKFKKASKPPEQKAAEAQEKAQKKLQQQELKEQRAQARAEHQAKMAQEKAVEKARKSLDKSIKKSQKEQEKAKGETLTSKIKSKFQKFQKTPQEKAAQLQEKEQKRVQNQQLKEQRAKARAAQKVKKAEITAAENAKKLEIKKQKAAEKAVNQKNKAETKTKSASSVWKSFTEKFKFKKKKEQAPSSVVNKYIDSAINPKKKKTKSISVPTKI